MIHSTRHTARHRRCFITLPPVGARKAHFPAAALKSANYVPVSRPPDDHLYETQGPRNEVGVQLLSPRLRSQIFRGIQVPPPDPSFIQIARDHLKQHGLDTSQASVLPPISFPLPPLQGKTIDHHFHRIGAAAAEPHLSLAKSFANIREDALPPRPDAWVRLSGWTKYYPDGTFEPVDDLGDETMVCFDVETMPPYHHFPIMACAMSPTAWYAWISPWLLGESESPAHLIPMGNPKKARVVVGHNVSYDRARVREEYSIRRTETRWLDTMSFHVAVKGISSHQRPQWMSHRKKKREAKEQVEGVANKLLDDLDAEVVGDEGQQADIEQRRQQIQDDMLNVEASIQEEEADVAEKRWRDITAMNSLAEIARLHCGIEIDKAMRNDFMTLPREHILQHLEDYVGYCANDVFVTHAVYRKILPEFLTACPSPVSWAGVMFMGNSFLGVDQSWENYIQSAEAKYHELEDDVRGRLEKLALQAKELMDEPEKWEMDVWLKQLDWTPKVAGKSRGIEPPPKAEKTKVRPLPPEVMQHCVGRSSVPRWYVDLVSKPLSTKSIQTIIPLLLRFAWNACPMFCSSEHGWVYRTQADSGTPLQVSAGDELASYALPAGEAYFPISKRRVRDVTGSSFGAKEMASGRLVPKDAARLELAQRLCEKESREAAKEEILALADELSTIASYHGDPWLMQLNWDGVQIAKPETVAAPSSVPVTWPKWFWELTAPKAGKPPGSLDLTSRSRLAPLLLRLKWSGWPLFHSRQHGWTFRVSPSNQETFQTRHTPLKFTLPADDALNKDATEGYTFYKLPHKDGDKANVGSPLAKPFMKYAENGTLTSPGGDAKDALTMNAQCSYWISARDRVMKQMVVWDGEAGTDMGFPKLKPGRGDEKGQKWGMILPQVITMGTVTRRAIETTWLTASNAKANRVGSELKAMVRAPPGYAIVGADVDSEELWISSLMGDAQFGVHGATALGWMTLEGSKQHGTDLHSKTAAILGISRDQAKVFNYSRIYGAGKKHAALLLRQGNPNMSPEDAKKLAENLYSSTKGRKMQSKLVKGTFGREFWYGGTESFVFNKLEAVAESDQPRTPALGCAITHALRKQNLPRTFGSNFMTSRINWVVQSSGVDYLHLLIVAMEHLIKKYNINARYLLSVHDELRYLVTDADKYRCALALQVANLWTRCQFAWKLGMEDLPQSVAFFSSVDIDWVLRKEVDLECITPSQSVPITPGERVDIAQVLEKTNGGSLWKDGRRMRGEEYKGRERGKEKGYVVPDCLGHRAKQAAFLRAQCTTEKNEIEMLARELRAPSNPPKPVYTPSGPPPWQEEGSAASAVVSRDYWEEALRHEFLTDTTQQQRRPSRDSPALLV
ncbi:DNA-directed DNA polymerase gamma mip1 [Tulasnella sp. 403]|nr:DNA-directed DNA polymerase gamma mip1 [Tulasnella sp. 403]